MKTGLNRRRRADGFTRAELFAVMAGLLLLTAIVLPALASPRVRSQRVSCANNLRQIGAANQLWGNDHGDLPPYAVAVADGGTRAHALAVNTWLHFSWISNELASPMVLLCPSDTGRPARDFTGDPSGGYVHPNFANRATSYFISHIATGSSARYLTGDRNLNYDALTSGCNFFVGPVFASNRGSPVSPRWSAGLHNQAGNVLAWDGRVDQLSNPQLQQNLQGLYLEDASSFHFITPR